MSPLAVAGGSHGMGLGSRMKTPENQWKLGGFFQDDLRVMHCGFHAGCCHRRAAEATPFQEEGN